MARLIYSYRISHGPKNLSWVFRSYDPLPWHVGLSTVQYLAVNACGRYSHWWVCGNKHGVASDEFHALRSASRFGRATGLPVFFGRIVHEPELEEDKEETC
jgi:hypothetical protein